MICCTLWGNGYARIYRDKFFRPVRLQLLHPYDIEPILTYDDELFYRDNTGLFIPCYGLATISPIGLPPRIITLFTSIFRLPIYFISNSIPSLLEMMNTRS